MLAYVESTDSSLWNFCSWSTRIHKILPDTWRINFIPSLTKNYFRAELVFLKQYYRYYFSRNLWLFSMGWSDSHFCLIALIISLRVVYILSFYLYSFSLHFLFILSYRPLCFLYTSSLIRFLLLPYCVICLGSISLLPDTPWLSSFHFHDNPATPLDCEIAFTAFSFSLSLPLSPFSPYWFIFFSSWLYFSFCN